MKTGNPGSVRDRYKLVSKLFYCDGRTLKMQRAHKAPPKIKLRILENFTKNEDFYKKPRNNFFSRQTLRET